MRVKSIGPVLAGGFLLALVSAQACGGEGKSSKTGPAAGGTSGSGGAGSGGDGGAGKGGSKGGGGAPTVMCDTTTCQPVTVPIPGSPAIPACCPEGMENTCGVDTALIGQLGVMFEQTCQPRDQPGTLDPECPATESVMVDGGFTIQFPGCCRPNGQCGYMADEIALIPGLAAFTVELGLGCVDSRPFLEGGAPEPCGSGGGAGGAGGEAGTPGMGGAAGTPGEGGAAGDPASAGMGGN
jgi:hypothetical protein